MNTQDLCKQNTLVKHYAGSLAYGTNLPSSDIDFRGIFLAPREYTTPFQNIEEVSITDEEDTKLYELNKFMKLALDCNPNILETLWVDESSIVETTPAYELLVEHRSEFLCQEVSSRFTGYAKSQLNRIKGHNTWINNPQSEELPRQTDFVSMVQNFTADKVFKFDVYGHKENHRLLRFSGDLYGVYEDPKSELFDVNYLLNTDRPTDEDFRTTVDGERRFPKYIVKFNRDEYKRTKEKHKNYWKWKRERNESRSVLEEQFGYDTKHAMHLVRLLRMGKEILTTGQVNVLRPDAEELLSIRNGSWTYDELIEYAEEMDREVYELKQKTDLPKKPNIKLATKVILDIQDQLWLQARNG